MTLMIANDNGRFFESFLTGVCFGIIHSGHMPDDEMGDALDEPMIAQTFFFRYLADMKVKPSVGQHEAVHHDQKEKQRIYGIT